MDIQNCNTDKQLSVAAAQRKNKGQLLKQYDSDRDVIGAGPLGSKRLVYNIAIDFQEQIPSLPWEAALTMALGYYQRTHASIES